MKLFLKSPVRSKCEEGEVSGYRGEEGFGFNDGEEYETLVGSGFYEEAIVFIVSTWS